jgi:hypothetical protein
LLLFFPHLPLSSKTEIEMLGQLDMVRHPAGVVLGLLLAVLIATLIAPVAADDVALVPLMTADDIGIALVVVFAELEFGEHLRPSLRP